MKYLRTGVLIKTFLLCCLLVSSAFAQVNNYYVATTGSDSNDGSETHPWKTIQHADAALRLGTNGTFVHVAPGTYTGDIITTHAGTSTQRVTFISDTPLGAHIVGNGSNLIVWKITGDYQSQSQFDVTGTATDYEGLSYYASHGRATGNKIHDLPGTACPANGGEGIGDAGGAQFNLSDNQAIGNVINNIGPNGCNSIHGIYWTQPGDVAENNIVGHVSGQCITSYHGANQLVISNNTVFNCGHHGILLGNNINSLNNTTVANNIVVNVVSGLGIDCYAGLGSNIHVGNNLLFNTGGVGGAQVTNCTVSGTIPNSDPLFVNYQPNGSGDYHLKPGSVAINAGTTSCAAQPALNPCTPSTDIVGVVHPTPPSIGAYVFGSVQDALAAPTGLVAVVH